MCAKSVQTEWVGLIVALLYVCSGAIYILFFGFDLTNFDEFTYAAMTADFARLFVSEPFFYGQDYNFPADAWLAAPLLVAAQLFDALTAVNRYRRLRAFRRSIRPGRLHRVSPRPARHSGRDLDSAVFIDDVFCRSADAARLQSGRRFGGTSWHSIRKAAESRAR